MLLARTIHEPISVFNVHLIAIVINFYGQIKIKVTDSLKKFHLIIEEPGSVARSDAPPPGV